MHAVSSVFLVRVDDGLRVTQGPEVVALALQLAPQLSKVVDFSVADDSFAAILTEERLTVSRQVDDLQPPMSQPNPAAEMGRTLVRSAIRQAGHHALQLETVDDTGAVGEEDPGDTAHRAILGTRLSAPMTIAEQNLRSSATRAGWPSIEPRGREALYRKL
jgi:hypothetical protein